VHSSSFFESLGLGLVSQSLGHGLGRQGLDFGLERGLVLGLIKTKTKTMLTCVTFRLIRHLQWATILEFFNSLLFGKPGFKILILFRFRLL